MTGILVFHPADFRGTGRSTNGITSRPWSIADRILPLRTTMWSLEGGRMARPWPSRTFLTPTPARIIQIFGGCKTLWPRDNFDGGIAILAAGAPLTLTLSPRRGEGTAATAADAA